MKTLKFASDLVSLILSGEKTSTWRLFDDKDLQVGDECECINKQTGEVFGELKITAVREKKLGEITDSDYNDGHERFLSLDAMYSSYREYYGDRVTPETIVKMLTFTFTSKSV